MAANGSTPTLWNSIYVFIAWKTKNVNFSEADLNEMNAVVNHIKTKITRTDRQQRSFRHPDTSIHVATHSSASRHKTLEVRVFRGELFQAKQTWMEISNFVQTSESNHRANETTSLCIQTSRGREHIMEGDDGQVPGFPTCRRNSTPYPILPSGRRQTVSVECACSRNSISSLSL